MRKKVIIVLLLLIPFISVFLIVSFRLFIEPSNEEIIEKLRDKSYYSVDTEYTIKNSRGEKTEEATLYFSKDYGGRIDFGNDRIKFYNESGIVVKDNISNREYTMDEEMDIIHSIAFMNNLLSFPIKSDSLKEAQEEWGETKYIEFESRIFMGNNHLDSMKIFIDKKEQIPIGAIIFDKDGKESIRIRYKHFEELKKMDDLF